MAKLSSKLGVEGLATAAQGALADTSVQATDPTGQAIMPTGTTAERTGSPDAGALRFNSTEVSFEGYNGTEWGSIGGGGALDFVATGTISNGETVGVLSDGTVQTVTTFKTDPVTFETGTANFNSAVYDTNSNKVVIVYSDGALSNKITGVVGTVSNGDITFGTPVVIQNNAANCYNVRAVFNPSNNKVIAFYRDSGLGRLESVVLTVSGTSLSVGSFTTVHTSVNAYADIDATFDTSSNKAVVFARETNNITEAFVGTVSGTSISFGSPVVFESDTLREIGCTFDSANNKVIVVYRRTSDDKGYAKVGTVSGTSISFGSRASFVDTGTGFYPRPTFDSQNNKVVVAYRNDSDSGKGYASVGTVSGTSISFGTPVKFLDDTSIGEDNMSVVFNPTTNAVQIFLAGNGTVTTGTVSGTSITFGETQSGLSTGLYASSVYNPDASLFVYAMRIGTGDGQAQLIDIGSSINGFVGIAAEDISDNASGEITITGGVNEGQTGLTTGATYYMQSDGSLSTISSDVKVGIALSATKLLMT
jgi:hypothetical protein